MFPPPFPLLPPSPGYGHVPVPCCEVHWRPPCPRQELRLRPRQEEHLSHGWAVADGGHVERGPPQGEIQCFLRSKATDQNIFLKKYLLDGSLPRSSSFKASLPPFWMEWRKEIIVHFQFQVGWFLFGAAPPSPSARPPWRPLGRPPPRRRAGRSCRPPRSCSRLCRRFGSCS